MVVSGSSPSERRRKRDVRESGAGVANVQRMFAFSTDINTVFAFLECRLSWMGSVAGPLTVYSDSAATVYIQRYI